MKVLVLGAGKIGYVVVRDLIESPHVSEVIIGDIDVKKADRISSMVKSDKISTQYINVTDHDSLIRAMRQVDAVANCTWYTLAIHVTKASISAGVNCLDLGGLYYYTLKQLELDKEARSAGVTYILGMGVAPGATNIMAMYGASKLDQVAEIHIRGGTPSTKGFKLGFLYSPRTYLEEFTKDAIIYQNGEFRAVPPGSGRELVKLPDPFNVEVEMYYALHSELATLPRTIKGVKNVDFKMTYYPELVKIMKLFYDVGLASEKPIEVRGVKIAPIDVLYECLSRLKDERGDRIWIAEAVGEKNGRSMHIKTYLISLFNEKWSVSGSAYGTGISASIAVQMLAQGDIEVKGVVPPEICIESGPFFVELAKRGIPVYEVTEVIRKLN